MKPKSELEMTGLFKLKASHFDLAADRLNEAFDEDPCIKYLIGSDIYDYKKAINIHKYTLKIGLLYGSILTTGDLLEGITIWLPPFKVDITTWMFIRAGGLTMVKTVRKDFIQVVKKYNDYSLKIHHQNVSIPHWYLLSMGVGKEYQGKGFAGKMLMPVFNFFDQNGYPCYLETHNPRNIAFYEHFGFAMVEEGKLPDSDKKHYAMLRLPQK